MVSTHEFLSAVERRLQVAGEQASALLPTILVLACLDILPIAGAGLSVMGSIRLPIGSTDESATFVEQLQFASGTGPCLAAASSGESAVSDERTIATSWPIFHAELTAQSPCRSTMSIPVEILGLTGALNFYSTDPSGVEFPPIEEVVAAVVPPINELMAAEPSAHGPQGIVFPTWIVTPPVQARLDVWVATGMIMEHAGYTSENGLAALRGYAYSHSLTVEEVSQALINRDLTTADVLED